MSLNRRQRFALILCGMVLASVAMPVLASLSQPVGVSDGVTFTAADGPSVAVSGDWSVDGENLFDDANTVNISTVNNGQATFSSNGDAEVGVVQIEGTYTELTDISASTNNVTINPSDKKKATVGGGLDSLDFRNPTPDDGSTDFRYSASGSSGLVALNGLASNEPYAAVDESTGDTVAFGQSDSNGRVVFDTLDTGTYDVRITSGEGAPGLSDPEPEGETSTTPTEVSVHVDDDDFPNDEVDVEFFVDGSSVGTDTVTSEGRVSVSISDPGAGEHTVKAEASDAFGQTSELSWTFGTPDTFEIRNATAPNNLVDDRTVNVRFDPVDSDTVYDRSTSDGTIDMSGLPTTNFIVYTTSVSGYHNGTVYVGSITNQQQMYLVSESVSTVEVRFILEDDTGTFDEDSRLNIDRVINVSGSNEYRTIHSDEFGVEGVTTRLQEGNRYKLRLETTDGRTQTIGPYRADVSETVTIRPSEATISIQGYTDGWAANATRNNDSIIVNYEDRDEITDSVKVIVHERNNRSNLLTGTDTYVNQQQISAEYDIPTEDMDTEWVVTFEIERGNESYTVTRLTEDIPEVTIPGLGDTWRTIFAVAFMLMLGGAFSVRNKAIGGVVYGLVGGLLYWSGWLGSATLGAAVGLYLFIAIVYAIYIADV